MNWKKLKKPRHIYALLFTGILGIGIPIEMYVNNEYPTKDIVISVVGFLAFLIALSDVGLFGKRFE